MKKSKSSVAIFLIGILIISVGFMIQKHKNSFSTLATSQQSNLTEETSMLTVAFFFGNVFPYRKKGLFYNQYCTTRQMSNSLACPT